MRFILTMKADNRDPGAMDPKLLAAIGQFSEEMTKSGVVIATGGLAPRITRVKASAGKLSTVDGPFPETKEMIAGWALIQASSKEEALEHARRFMKLHQDILGASWEAESEIQHLFGPEDFAAMPR